MKQSKNKETVKRKSAVKKNQSGRQLTQESNQDVIRLLKMTGMIVGIILFLVCLGSVSFILVRNFKMIDQLTHEVIDLRSAMNTDSVRQHKLQKILKIIRDHNTNLSSEETYDIANTIHEMSIRYSNLDIDLLCAVITHESANSWNPEIVSPAGAMGLMQIMPVTGMFLAEYEGIPWTSPEDVLFNSAYNIRMGAQYLSALLQEYPIEGALAAYNGGERTAAVYLANGKDEKYLREETRGYIPAIKALYENYLSVGM